MADAITQSKKERLIFIDVLRGIAVMWMIETHVVDVCLNPYFKSGWFYNLVNISNGFVAVTFLFCAGAGFWLAASRKFDEYKSFKPSLWVYLRRLGFILGMAYFLNMPVFSFTRVLQFNATEFWSIFQNDILQTIVYSSLIALFLFFISPSIKWVKYISVALAIGIFMNTDAVWRLDPFQHMHPFFAYLFAKYPASKFQLMPWSGYFFSGLAVTAFFMDSQNKERLAKILAVVAFIIPFIVFSLIQIPGVYYKEWWQTSPMHNIFRISGSTFFFAMLFLLESKYKNWKWINVLKVSGQESLFMYVSHIMIVYGTIANFGLRYLGANHFNPIVVMLVWAIISSSCYSVAWAWHNLKGNNQKHARLVMLSFTALFLAIFIFKQY